MRTMQKKSRYKDSRQLQVYTMIAIPLLLVFIFCYLPMFGVVIAFKDYRFNTGIIGSKWVGFDNFKFLFKTPDFLRITWNTLYMNFLFITIGTIAAIIIAIVLFELKSRAATKVFQTILITPNFLSWVIVSYMVYGFLNPSYGLINTLFVKFGIGAVDWYNEPKYWPAILVVCSVWKNVGMDSVIYYAALMGIDHSIYEAADIDGASKLKKVWYITIPEITSIISIMIILKIGGIFRADFGLFYQVPRNVGALYSKTDVVDTYIFRALTQIGDMSMSAAIGLLQSVVGLVMVLITNYITKKINPDNAMF